MGRNLAHFSRYRLNRVSRSGSKPIIFQFSNRGAICGERHLGNLRQSLQFDKLLIQEPHLLETSCGSLWKPSTLFPYLALQLCNSFVMPTYILYILVAVPFIMSVPRSLSFSVCFNAFFPYISKTILYYINFHSQTQCDHFSSSSLPSPSAASSTQTPNAKNKTTPPPTLSLNYAPES